MELDTEFTHQIKEKIEILLKTLIEEYNFESIISLKLRYRIDFNKAFNSQYYKLCSEKRSAKGEVYHYGHEYVPTNFHDWLWYNFPEYMHVEEIYDHICATGYITQENLRLLNRIYENHPPKTA